MTQFLADMNKASDLRSEAFALVMMLQSLYNAKLQDAHTQEDLDSLHRLHRVLLAAYKRHERRMDACFKFYL
jgi:hypothetical protein